MNTVYKLLAVDIDGTILNSAHQLTDKVGQALHELATKGVHVVLVSARTPRSVFQFADQIGLAEPAVTLNGALVVDQNRTILSQTRIPSDDLLTILSLCRRYHLAANLFVGFDWYVERVDEMVEGEAVIIGFGPTVVPSLELFAQQTEKVLIMGNPERLRPLHYELSRQAPGINASFSKPNYCEITASGVTKVTGLVQVSQYLHIPPAAMVAVGDNYNDIEMLNFAGLGIAMGNAPVEVKATADLVIGHNDEDGVAGFVLSFDSFQINASV